MILEQFKTDNVTHRVFGHGFGSFIYSDTPITVVTHPNGVYTEEIVHEIPLFHNGYFGALFKCGIVGVVLYISFLVMLYVYSFIAISRVIEDFYNENTFEIE